MSSTLIASTMIGCAPNGTVAAPAAKRGPGLLVRALVWWFSVRAKQRSRRQLAELDPRLLRDIGLDRATAFEESRRSLWQ